MKFRGGWILLFVLTAACTRKSPLPEVGSERYRALCSAFYLGLAALQSGEDVNARKGLTEATQIAPEEPAGWLNLGLLQFRQQDFEGAYQSVTKALGLVSNDSRIEALLGVIESRRGKTSEALAHLKRAVDLDRKNLKAAYALAQETERQNSDSADIEAQKLLEQILSIQPNNLAVLIDNVRLAAKRNDSARLKQAVARLSAESSSWPEPARQQLASLQQQASGPNVRAAAVQAQFLKNVLVRVPAYRQSLDAVRTPATSAGEPFLKFFLLPSPRSEPDAPDKELRFERKTLDYISAADTLWLGTVTFDSESNPVPVWADQNAVHIQGGATLAFPQAKSAMGTPMSHNAVLAADLNYDFKVDLVFATAAGLRFYQQSTLQRFQDVTGQTRLPAAILNGSYTGAWAFDFDLDGDLDVVLGITKGEPLVLRNNGDGSFLPVHPFSGVDGLLDFADADVDGDGDPDVALINGKKQVVTLSNERLGDYRLRELRAGQLKDAVALNAADVNGDGLPDFIVLQQDGRVVRLSDRNTGWDVAQIAASGGTSEGTGESLLVADLDNNGALDLVVNGQILLGDGKTFSKLTALGAELYAGSADLNGDGLVDLTGLARDQSGRLKATAWTGQSTKRYHWQTIRPKAAHTTGDQRINSFGVGGEIEIRADLLTQKQIIREPRLHFGMGSHPTAEFARIGWPNGLIQTEFQLKADQTLVAEQRLKGSCPYLFAWNGTRMQFVKDVAPMSGALGAHAPDGTPAEIGQTREWFKIASNQLTANDGTYRLSVTDEYWETYYIDQYALMAVDHPPGTEMYVDERVAIPAAPLKVYLTKETKPFASAHDERGADVSDLVHGSDGKYLDSFAPDTYRGIARDHFVELALPETAPRGGPLYLVAEGWLHPWDDSTLVSVNQGRRPKPEELRIEVPNGKGGWSIAAPRLGMPAGRQKTILIDLAPILGSQHERRFRIRTNLEIYWDRLSWATGVSDKQMQTQELSLRSASLQHRGFSSVDQKDHSSPEIPDYQHIADTGQRWRDLEGYYTRYGPVESLLQRRDDRYVIANSGDELKLTFDAPRLRENNWVRDFVLVGDGWMKEGDYSFRESQTVLPLPYHGMRSYPAKATELENDPAYRLHKDDWRIFHTRYVAGEALWSALWHR